MNSAGTQRSHESPVISRHLRALFDGLPALAGFRVRTDLMVADVCAVTDVESTPRRLHVSVMRALVDLAECHPEVIVLMRGRSFARHQ